MKLITVILIAATLMTPMAWALPPTCDPSVDPAACADEVTAFAQSTVDSTVATATATAEGAVQAVSDAAASAPENVTAIVDAERARLDDGLDDAGFEDVEHTLGNVAVGACAHIGLAHVALGLFVRYYDDQVPSNVTDVYDAPADIYQLDWKATHAQRFCHDQLDQRFDIMS